MDEQLKKILQERAYALWEADGCPDGRELDYWKKAEDWFKAEEENLDQSVTGEEDPYEALDHEVPITPPQNVAAPEPR
jgi:hypothetical protein